MKKKQIYLLVALTIMLLLIIAYALGEFENANLYRKSTNYTNFVNCLNEKQIFVYDYGSSNQVKIQLKMFHEYSKEIKVIDCSVENCVGVLIYPSWNIDGKILHGGLSLAVLEQFSECKITS